MPSSLKLAILSILFSVMTSTYADGKSDCQKGLAEGRFSHCAYLTGISAQDNGRYIKIYHTDWPSYSHVQCYTTNEDLDVELSDTNQSIGTIWHHYYICKDIYGSQCELVGNYVFENTIIDHPYNGEPTRYKAEPNQFVIDISKVKNSYPQCTIRPHIRVGE